MLRFRHITLQAYQRLSKSDAEAFRLFVNATSPPLQHAISRSDDLDPANATRLPENTWFRQK